MCIGNTRILSIFLILFALSIHNLFSQNLDTELDALLKAEGFDIDLQGELLTEEDMTELLGDEIMSDILRPKTWELDFKLRTGVGYGDNVLYGAYEEVSSGYFLGAIDSLYFRTKDDPWNAFIYFYGEHLEYFENVDAGRLYVTQGQLSRLSVDQKKNYGLSSTHLFYDQVFDASADLDNFDTFGVSAHQLEVEPFLDIYLNNGIELRLEGMVSGSRYEDSYDDSDSFGGLVKFKKPIGDRSLLMAEYFFEDRNYLEKSSRDAQGYAIDGQTRLQIGVMKLTLKVDSDKQDGWNFRHEFSHYAQRDKEAGYSDYNRMRFSQKASKAWKQWELILSGRCTWYDYLVRTAAFDGSDLLYRRAVEGSFILNRELSEKTSLFFESQYERNRSNSPDNVFSATRFVLGIERAL